MLRTEPGQTVAAVVTQADPHVGLAQGQAEHAHGYVVVWMEHTRGAVTRPDRQKLGQIEQPSLPLKFALRTAQSGRDVRNHQDRERSTRGHGMETEGRVLPRRIWSRTRGRSVSGHRAQCGAGGALQL